MTKKQRIIFSILSIWSFVHLILYLLGGKEEGIKIWGPNDRFQEIGLYVEHTTQFFPFESNFVLNGLDFSKDHINRLEYYDLTELLVYAVSPWLFFGLYKFIQRGK